jgi:argininosuccinate synthase
MIDFCHSRAIPIRATKDASYSTDANMLGLTHEAGDLESLNTSATLVEPQMGCWPQDAPDQAETFEVRFDSGRPIEINGQPVSVLEAFRIANDRAGTHGVGILHVVENRLVGLKSRGIYEQPGIGLLGYCYELLRQLILDQPARQFFSAASQLLATQVYSGQWFTLASVMAERAVSEVALLCTGKVRVEVYKGNIIELSITDVPYSLYNEEDVSMEAVGDFDHHDSEGMIRIMSLSARAAANAGQVRDRLERTD